MKLLFDQNLSFRLVRALARSFPESRHLILSNEQVIKEFHSDPVESVLVIE